MILLLLLSCATSVNDVEQACQDMCRNLVQDCGIEAYPSYQSCTQGCLYESDQGGDVVAQWACIEDAACVEFEIIECQAAHGASGTGGDTGA